MNHGCGYWTSTSKAATFYGVTQHTIRRWCDNDKIVFKRNPSNQRSIFISTKSSSNSNSGKKVDLRKNIVYARVSSSKQKDDLERQSKMLLDKFPNYLIVKDIGSGLNYKRRGLLKILRESHEGKISKLVISSKDRLCRFGFELFKEIFLQNNTELVVLEQIDKSPEQEFTEDILAILQVFACRWNGKRRYVLKNTENKIEIDIDLKKNIKIVE